MKKELIEKLKKPELAQPLCLRSEEEQAVLIKASPSNCLVMSGDNKWTPSRNHSVLSRTDTYILKPGYKPEPEYEDIEIVCGDLWLILRQNMPGRSSRCLYNCSIHYEFVGFFVDAGTLGEREVEPTQIARLIAAGKTVVARFVKEVKCESSD